MLPSKETSEITKACYSGGSIFYGKKGNILFRIKVDIAL